MDVRTPQAGDVVGYYGPRQGNETRQPIRATVEAVYPIRNVSFARAPARQYGNDVDLVYFIGDGGPHRAICVPYTADAIEDECWIWPA